MSILIKSIVMPKNCWECHFGHGDSGVCVVDFKQHGDWNEPQNCPLVPVPPHGRLGDLDALAESVRNPGIFPPVVSSEVFAFLRNAPTIIKAEEGE